MCHRQARLDQGLCTFYRQPPHGPHCRAHARATPFLKTGMRTSTSNWPVFERSITLMRDATSIGQLFCMALRNSSDQKEWQQSASQSLENQSRFSAFWLIKKEVR